MFFSRRAQSLMEYALLVSMVVAAVVYMFPRVKRTTNESRRCNHAVRRANGDRLVEGGDL